MLKRKFFKEIKGKALKVSVIMNNYIQKGNAVFNDKKGAVSWEYIALIIIVLVVVGVLITFLKPMLVDTVLPKLQETIMNLFDM